MSSGIHITNTLTKQREALTPLEADHLRLYVCGVTVYDECHIGHARFAAVFDMVRRYLMYRGWQVTYVCNITDVDDKIIQRAQQELRETSATDGTADTVAERAQAIAERYIQAYHRDMASLEIWPPDVEPRATKHIPQMVELIQQLIDREAAYVEDGSVYFSVRHHERYGQLSGQDLDQMRAGTRIESGEGKRDPLDFALWKAAKPDEPSWSSPWGDGRPGWHIECSAMSMQYLGRTFDVHAGGRDLIFPHHENEIAQSEAATGQPFAKYWMHNGLVTINGEKMSKSLDNWVAIHKVLEQYSPDTLKLFFLSSHYASPVDYSQQRMDESAQELSRFSVFTDRVERTASHAAADTTTSADIETAVTAYRTQFEQAMDDDFNTPRALAVLHELVHAGHRQLDMWEQQAEPASLTWAVEAQNLFQELAPVLGLSARDWMELRPGVTPQLSATEIEARLETRQQARGQQDFETADAIRNELNRVGIIVEDHGTDSAWRYAPTGGSS